MEDDASSAAVTPVAFAISRSTVPRPYLREPTVLAWASPLQDSNLAGVDGLRGGTGAPAVEPHSCLVQNVEKIKKVTLRMLEGLWAQWRLSIFKVSLWNPDNAHALPPPFLPGPETCLMLRCTFLLRFPTGNTPGRECWKMQFSLAELTPRTITGMPLLFFRSFPRPFLRQQGKTANSEFGKCLVLSSVCEGSDRRMPTPVRKLKDNNFPKPKWS